MNRSIRQRVLAAMGAHSIGMGITVGIQLASLPLFLATWDTATYGVWLLLSALQPTLRWPTSAWSRQQGIG